MISGLLNTVATPAATTARPDPASTILPAGVTPQGAGTIAAQAPTPAPAQTGATLQPSIKATAVTGTPTPTPAPASGSTPAPTPTPAATTANINSDFISDFGRPADQVGIDFWAQALKANPDLSASALNQMILGGAQTQDAAAAKSLNGQGSLASNWTEAGLETSQVQPQNDVWDSQSNQWVVKATPAPAPAPVPTASVYTAALDTVTPQQTVAGQFANDTNPNNPLMVEAATQGNEQSNARGLLNSSIGVGAAQQAMYNAALPMSEQDASTNAQASLSNQSAVNNASQFDANAQNQVLLQNMQDTTSLATAQLNANTQLALGQLSSQTQQTIQGMVNSNQQLLQSSTSAANAFNSTMNNIAAIEQSTTMDGGTKQADIDNNINELQNFLSGQSGIAQAGGATALPNLAQYFPSPAGPPANAAGAAGSASTTVP